MRRSSVLILLSTLLSPSLFAADAQQWLLRMGEAADQKSFRGIFIYERSGNFSTHSIWHRAQGGGSSRERLLQLDGPEQEVLLADGSISCATANLAEHFVDMQHWAGRKLDVSRLQQGYELKVLGNSRVAGRSAAVLLLLPRDANRYARELHLDSETGLPLKLLLLNGQGQLLERLQFTSLEPNQQITDQDLQAVTDCRALPVSAKSTDVQSLWRVDWVPSGFTQVAVIESPGTVSGKPVQGLVFDDGLARFSIFIESLGDAVVSDAHAQVGPTVVVSRPINTARGQFMVTVVGEVPLVAAERIVLSVAAKDLQGVAP